MKKELQKKLHKRYNRIIKIENIITFIFLKNKNNI